MNKYQKALNEIMDFRLVDYDEYGDEVDINNLYPIYIKEEIDVLQELIDEYSKLEKALDKACDELTEYTQVRCEQHCGGGCYNEDKTECDDDCFFKNKQTSSEWKEFLLR